MIGARNDRFGRLDFVEPVIRDLHRAVMDDQLGACLPALPDGRDLLTGGAASCGGIKDALHDAIRAAAIDQATLFVYFLGHGQLEDEDLYLIGTDTPRPEQVDSESAVPIGQRVKELLRQNSTVDGLMLVLDACHVGAAVTSPVPGLLRTGVEARMEILAATRADETASDGCFTRSLITLLNRGSTVTADKFLRAYDEHSRLRQIAPPSCRAMPDPVHASLRGGIDAGLWLGRNHVADIRPSIVGTPDAAAGVARLTRNLVPTTYVGKLMTLRWSGRNVIAITGGAGVGKSALLAGLARISVAGGFGVDAFVEVQPGDTLTAIAARLDPQLQLCADYTTAARRWMNNVPSIEQDSTSIFDRIITGPMAGLTDGEQVLVGVDGVDLLGTVDRRRLLGAFAGKQGATLIVTGRVIADIDADATLTLPDRDLQGVTALLTELVTDEHGRDRIIKASGGEWLLARILAGLWRAGRFNDFAGD